MQLTRQAAAPLLPGIGGNNNNPHMHIHRVAYRPSMHTRPRARTGVRTRPPAARKAMLALAEASRYPVAVMPDAKGMFPEDHEQCVAGGCGRGGEREGEGERAGRVTAPRPAQPGGVSHADRYKKTHI